MSRTEKALEAVLHRLNPSTPVSLVLTDSGYFRVFRNWLAHFERHDLGNLLVVALDEESYADAQDLAKHVIGAPWDRETNSIWKMRAELIANILGCGYDVIHSDADAVWLQDPVAYTTNLNCDLAFSQGTVWPPDVHEINKVVVCCGFFFARSSSATRSFFSSWLKAMTSDHDDQRAVNRIIVELGGRWRQREDYTLGATPHEFRCFRQPQFAELSSGATIALLPHRLFQRVPEHQKPIVAHYLSDKEGVSAETRLREMGRWIV